MRIPVLTILLGILLQTASAQSLDNRFTTYLLFEGDAMEAVELYTSLFPNSEVVEKTRLDAQGQPDDDGKSLHIVFVLDGQQFIAFDSSASHPFTFTPAISLFVQADSEEQVDQWFEALSKGGQVLMPLASYPFSDRFAWVNDRFGVSWQLSLANED